MTVTQWNRTTNGRWISASSWTAGVPNATLAAQISPASGSVIVTVDQAGQAALSLTTNRGSGIFINGGGDLTLSQSSTIGALAVLDGSIDLQNGGNISLTFGVSSGGAVQVDAGTLLIQPLGVATVDGTIRGNGTLAFGNGETLELNAGTSLLIAEVDVQDPKTVLQLGTNVTYGGILHSISTIDVHGHTLTLTSTPSAPSSLIGLITGSSGMLDIAGKAFLGAAIGGDALAQVDGDVVQVGNVAIGDTPSSSTQIIVTSSGTYEIEDWTISGLNILNTVRNRGLLTNPDTGPATIAAHFTNTGVVRVNTGTFTFSSPSTFFGTLEGSGTVALTTTGLDKFGAGLDVALTGALTETGTTIQLGASLGIGSTFIATGGRLSLQGQMLSLGSITTFNGVTVVGGGRLTNAGTLTIVTAALGDTNSTITNSGSIIQTGNITLGQLPSSTVTLRNGGTYDLAGDVSVGANGTTSLVNTAQLRKTAGTGVSAIHERFTSTGTLDVLTGTLETVADSSITGSLKGAGTFEFGGGTDLLNGGLSLTVATLMMTGGAAVRLAANQTYAGTFFEGSTTTLDLVTLTLTLKGSVSLFGHVIGDGTLQLKGTSDVSGAGIGEGAHLVNAGSAHVQGTGLLLGSVAGSTASLVNQAGGTFTLAGDVGINTNANVTITNAGLLQKSAGNQVSAIAPVLVSTGTLRAQSGTLSMAGGSIAGLVDGAGAFAFTGGTSTLNPGLSITVSTLALTGAAVVKLAANETYSGNFSEAGSATIDTGTATLTLGGTATISGHVAGAGKLQLNGTTDLSGASVNADARITNAGSAQLKTASMTLGNVLGSAPSLINQAGGTFSLAGDNGIGSIADTTITNIGLFVKNTGVETSVIIPLFANTGTLEIDAGTLQMSFGSHLQGKVTGAGTLALEGTNELGAVAIDVHVVQLLGSNVELDLKASVSYGGTFLAPVGTTIDLGDDLLSLSGLLNLTGTLSGTGGKLVDRSSLSSIGGLVVHGSATVQVTGTANSNGGLTLGDDAASNVVFDNLAGGRLTFTTTNPAVSTSGTASFINGGTLGFVNNAGVLRIKVPFTNTGLVGLGTGDAMEFDAGGSFGGTFSGSGAQVESLVFAGGTCTLQPGVSITVSSVTLRAANPSRCGPAAA